MIEFYNHSGVHTLRVSQFLPVERSDLWEFLCQPGNLSEITPSEMGFRVTSPVNSGVMYSGQIITYKVMPFKGIRVNWVTEISHLREGWYFVDEQRFGPYRFWHHKHFLEEVEGGTCMSDLVTYKMPLGWIGRIMNLLLVRRKLRQIFEYRQRVLEDRFGG